MKALANVRLAVLTARQDHVEALNKTFRNAGIASHCRWAGDLEALRQSLGDEPELVVIEKAFAKIAPSDIVAVRQRIDPRLPVLFLEETIDADRLEAAFREGANDVIVLKQPERLVAVAERELRLYRAERSLDATAESAIIYKKQIKALMADSPDALAYVQEGIIVDINPAWLEMMGYSDEADLIGQPVMDTFKPESRGPLKGAIVATLKGKWQNEALETIAIDKSGDEVKLRVSFLATEYDGEPCVKMNCSVIDDVNTRELKLKEDALSKDPATLLFHRGHFVELLRGRLKRKPDGGVRVLAWIRPDRFANVCNDVGHIASERVLVEFADLVSSQLQPTDICGRFGGITLMALLERSRLQDAEAWGERLVSKVAKHVFEINDRSTAMTCTIGLCLANDEVAGADPLILGARIAYERGKKAGGNATVTNETSSSDSRIQNYNAVWARHLKSALIENRFRLLQQPIVSLDGSNQNMFDLLVRMVDQRGRPVLPSEFIPAAERNRMMHAVDRWVITAALEFCQQRQPSAAFIKLSQQSLQDASLIEWLRKQVRNARIKPDQLCIEVSEQLAAQFIRETKLLCRTLRDLGVMFAIEHIGVGREPGQLIEHLEPDFIKIDGSLIGTIAADEAMQAAVKAIVEQATGFAVRTIAEQVEDANTMAVLWQLGIQYMQGHYVHEPEVVLQDPVTPRQPSGGMAQV